MNLIINTLVEDLATHLLKQTTPPSCGHFGPITRSKIFPRVKTKGAQFSPTTTTKKNQKRSSHKSANDLEEIFSRRLSTSHPGIPVSFSLQACNDSTSFSHHHCDRSLVPVNKLFHNTKRTRGLDPVCDSPSPPLNPYNSWENT